MSENKKVKVVKEKKIKRIRKKILIRNFYSWMDNIEESYRELQKRLEHPIGDIKAHLTLEQKGKSWHMEIRSVEDDQYSSITGDLYMIIKMLDLFRTIYDIVELRPDNYKEKKEEEKDE